MNKPVLIIVIPAVLASFCWFTSDWGLLRGVAYTGAEIVIVSGIVMLFMRRFGGRDRKQGS